MRNHDVIDACMGKKGIRQQAGAGCGISLRKGTRMRATHEDDVPAAVRNITRRHGGDVRRHDDAVVGEVIVNGYVLFCIRVST